MLPPATPAYVILENATLRGPHGPIFPNLNLTLEPGQRWAVLGPTGSGKGWLLSGLMGKLGLLEGRLRHPFLEGDPRYLDSIYGVLPSGSMALASMSQHHQLLLAREFHQLRWHGSYSLGAATVRTFLERSQVIQQNPFAVLPLSGKDRFEWVQQREITRFELQSLLDRPLVGLSNGELHRVVLARALLRDPRFLLLDAPFDGLDAKHRTSLVTILDNLSEEGIGVILSISHPMELPSGITHLLMVEDGKIKQSGSRKEFSHPANELSAKPKFTIHAGDSVPLPEGIVLVDCRDVTVRQGSVTLLKEISFRMFPGEKWALLGPNGSGKSTLLSLILADNPQVYANHVCVAGKQLGPGYSIWDRKALLGWVSPELEVHYPPQFSTLEVVLSGFTNSLGTYRAHHSDQLNSAHLWLETVGLQAIHDRPFAELTKVERRLVLIARSLVHRPLLLLFDEPCQGLDPVGTHVVLAAIDAIVGALSAGMIFVTHKAHEIPSQVDHLLLLDQGRTTYVGSRAKYTKPLPVF